jgi:addiction module HigA family antidote
MMTGNQYFPQSRPHPGETLAEKLEEMGMSSKEFAIRSGKPEKTISAVINGKSAITPDMAIQFETVTKIPAHFWMNSQRGYDEYIAREKYKDAIKKSIEWSKMFPIADMVRKGWIRAKTTANEKVSELFTHHSYF